MLPAAMFGQHLQEHQLENGVKSGMGSGEVFSPFKNTPKDSTKHEIIAFPVQTSGL